jgi:hypothetical protein
LVQESAVRSTVALASLPIVGTLGFAVDYSHANSVKAGVQAALGSTALMLAKDAPTATSGDLQTKALSYFTALSAFNLIAAAVAAMQRIPTFRLRVGLFQNVVM